MTMTIEKIGARTTEAALPPPETLIADPPALLPAPEAHVDVGAALATMLIEASFAQRKTARDERTAAETALEGAQHREVAAMRAQAEEKYEAAQAEGWSHIAGGALGIAGTALSVAGSVSVAKIGDGVSRSGPDLVKGCGGLWAGGHALSADTRGAEAKEAEHAAARMKTVADDASEDGRAARESVRKALDFLKEYEATEAQTLAAALHRA